MRNARQYLRSWETGRPRLESFQQYQDRAACARKSIVQRDEDDAARSLQKFNSSCFARLARSKFFTTTATALVILNAIWIAIELDNNDEPVLIDADVGFQIVENGFCFLFSSEILVRFAAYRRKAMCLTDAWFRFDLVLVLMMVFETWLVPLWLLLASESGTEFFTAGKLQVLRIARLLRLTRMTRLFEALPEMITMVKGITFAIRPVSITLFLLLMLLYVFAIVFRNQVEPGSDLEKDHFPSVTSSMWTLLMHGTLLDNVSILANRIKKDGDPLLTWAFLASIFCTNFTVLSMLIGIVCEMVSVVKQAEDERMAKNKLTSLLQDIMAVYDSDNSGSLKRCEWELFMKNADVCHVLSQYQVDVKGLQNLTDVLFLDGEEEDNSVSLGFDKILDLVIRMKGVNTATVEDVVQLRQYTKHRLDVLEHHLERGQERMEQHILRDQRDLLSERRSTTNSDSQLM